MQTHSALFLQTDHGLIPMEAEPFASEDALQTLLATSPRLFAETLGGTWLLVSREMGVPDETGAQRWSVDHLFLDQTGIPTLVEVKRHDDSRIRREVVGQMFDYLANAAAYWTVEHLQQALARTVSEVDQALIKVLGPDDTPEIFWARVAEHLAARHFRCLFVADEMPAELIRIIEFLNEQLSPTEVMGLEVQSRRSGNHQLISVTRVGETAHSAGRRRSATRNAVGAKQWIRNWVASTGEVSLADGVAAGYTEITLKTAISDLKNPKYCGEGGVLVLERGDDGRYRPVQ